MPRLRSGSDFALEIGRLTNLLRRVDTAVELPQVWRDSVAEKTNDLIRLLATAKPAPKKYAAEK